MQRRQFLLKIYKRLKERRLKLMTQVTYNFDILDNGERGGDSIDMATTTAGLDINSSLLELENNELIKIEQAITRFNNGTFGLCERCAKKIPLERLDALNYITTCIECQRQAELDDDFELPLVDWMKIDRLAIRDDGDKVTVTIIPPV